MKKSLIVVSLLFCLFNYGFGQKIQYSRSTFRVDDPHETQLVSNINGHHHILTFTYNRKPSITVFDPQLQLKEKKQLDFTIRKDCEVKLLSFPNHYFVYMHFSKPSAYEIWKVDDEGNSVYLSMRFKQIVDSIFRNNTSTLQLLNIHDGLYLTASLYYDTIKTMQSTIVQLDDQLTSLKIVKLYYPFDKDNEILRQTSLTKNALFILKAVTDQKDGNRLDLIKIDLASGKMIANSYKTTTNFYSDPRFVIDEKDSSILVYSMIRGEKIDRMVFISRLNSELQEQSPLTILRSQFRENTLSNFLFVKGGQSLWLNMFGNRRFQRTIYGRNVEETFGSMNRPAYSYGTNNLSYNQPTAVRFTILDKEFKVVNDSLIANKKKIMEIQPGPFAQFMMNDKGYLVLIQNYTPKRKGLMLLTADDNQYFSVTPLPVYDRFDYLLHQLRSTEKYFIIPYVAKNEMGLVKVTM